MDNTVAKKVRNRAYRKFKSIPKENNKQNMIKDGLINENC